MGSDLSGSVPGPGDGGNGKGNGGGGDPIPAADRPAVRFVGSLIIPFIALAVQWSLWDYFTPYVWFLFFPAAFFSAWVGGLAGGLTATIISALLVWYFFMPPALSFSLDQLSAGYSIAVFLAMGSLFAVFHERLRQSMRRTREALAASRADHETMSRLYRETLQADEQKSRFFARISHQLRTPLTLILAPLERRAGWQPGNVVSDADCRETESMLHNARLLHRYVIDLLDAARIEAGQMALSCTRIDLVPLVRAMASHFESIASKRMIGYDVSVPDTLIADVDVEKLQRILLDLLSNAFKYAPDGGAVALRLAQNDGGVLVEIEDNGVAVPAELRDAVFDRFPEHEGGQLRRPGGSGLGLSIAKDFVELHGGAITLEDGPGGGMLFSVHLPSKVPSDRLRNGDGVLDDSAIRWAVKELEADALPTVAGKVAALEGEDPLILVVEDDPWMNDFICSVLNPRYRVCAAFDGSEGADKALVLQPDLIVTDLMMPVMSGEEMVAKLRQQAVTADIPIVVISAGSDEKTRLQLLGEGVQDYLNKPFSTGELLARVGGLVKSRRRATAELARSAGRLRRLAEVVEQIAAVHDLPGLMAIVRRAVRELTGADGATLVMRDNGYCHYVDEDAIGPLWKGQRFPLESCISGWTMLHAEAVVIEDIYADPRIPYAAYRPTFVKSLSMVPIGRITPVGAIGSYWATPHKASVEELELQQALADAMSVGLANLDLYLGMANARQAAEESAAAVQESEKRFRQLFQEAPVSLCFVSGEGALADFNKRFEQMFGYGRADVPTLDEWWRLAYPDPAYRAEAICMWNDAVARAAETGHEIETAEYRITCKGGRKRVALVSGIALGKDFLVTFIDITERRQAEESLRRQTDELIRRNEELERFNRASIGREMDMIKLKQQINALAVAAGNEPPYPLAFLEAPEPMARKGD